MQLETQEFRQGVYCVHDLKADSGKGTDPALLVAIDMEVKHLVHSFVGALT